MLFSFVFFPAAASEASTLSDALETVRVMSDSPAPTVDFVSVDSLRPGLTALNLTVKILEAKEVLNKKHPDGSSTTIVECVVGDTTGTVIFSARNKHAEVCSPGKVGTIQNGKIDMFKGTMRLAAEKGGSGKVAEDAEDIDVKTSYDLSSVEYDLVVDL